MKDVARWGMIVVVLAVICGAVAFWVTRSHMTEKSHAVLLDDLPELAWVKKEFQLTDQQFAKVRELHIGYRPKCAEMCQRISEAHDKLKTAVQTHDAMSPELKKAIEEHAAVHAECQRSMLTHLYETAAVLDKEQARRYLEAMLPYAMDFKFSEPKGAHAHE